MESEVDLELHVPHVVSEGGSSITPMGSDGDRHFSTPMGPESTDAGHDDEYLHVSEGY